MTILVATPSSIVVMKNLYVLIIAISFSLSAKSQIFKPVIWSYAAKRTSDNTTTVFIKATIYNGWHIYSLNLPEGGPTKTIIKFIPSKKYSLINKTFEPNPIRKYDEAFHMNVSYFEKSVVFQQKVNIQAARPIIKGTISYMSCDAKRCLPEETIEFAIPLKG